MVFQTLEILLRISLPIQNCSLVFLFYKHIAYKFQIICVYQVKDINAQSVHLNSKSMNYTGNSITNYGRELDIEKENNQTRESDVMEFESDFFRDVPEEDELPLNFEIPGPIPDLVDLYTFGI